MELNSAFEDPIAFSISQLTGPMQQNEIPGSQCLPGLNFNPNSPVLRLLFFNAVSDNSYEAAGTLYTGNKCEGKLERETL